jgi:HEAT repeat protein
MSRSPSILVVGLIGLLAAGVGRAEEEPTFRDRPLSTWIAVLTGDKEVKHRQGALIALEQIGPLKSDKVLPALSAALASADQNEVVRESAAQTLGRLYERVKEANTPVHWDDVRDGLGTAVRKDKSPRVREAAAAALGRMEGDAAKAVPNLTAALKDEQQSVRGAAAEALRRIAVDKDGAKEVAGALPELELLVKDEKADHLGRAQAALAIGQIGAPEALPALGTLSGVAADAKVPADVRKAAVEALGRLGADAGAAAGRLGDVLTTATTPPEVRRAAVEALDRFGAAAKPALPALKKAVGDNDKFIRVIAMHALGRMGPDLGDEVKDVVAVLLPHLNDQILEVRVAAIQALGAIGREALGEDLKKVTARLSAQADDSRAAVRDAANAALGRLKSKP